MHNTVLVGHHYAQKNTNNANKTRVLLQKRRDAFELKLMLLCLYFVQHIMFFHCNVLKCIAMLLINNPLLVECNC
jgi:hypothetical protein